MKTRLRLQAAATLAVLAFLATTASAAPIAYTLTLSPMTILVDGETFNDAAITFHLLGDTDDIQADQEDFSLLVSGTFSIPGGPIGPAGSFEIGLFSPMGQLSVRSVVQGVVFEILTESPAFVGYDLGAVIVATAPRAQLIGSFLPAPNGSLVLTPDGLDPISLTFTAGVGAVAIPEPASLAMAIIAFAASAGLAVGRRWR